MISLIEAGADVNATDEDGLSALDLAAIMEQEHCVCTLLLAGASVSADAADEPVVHRAMQQLGLVAEPCCDCAAQATRTSQLSDALRGEACCPITHDVFSDPVVAADGTTYERSAIESECGTGW